MDPLILLLFVAVLALPLFLGSRRQKKAVREAQELQNSLQVGDRVMTSSGMHATVARLDDDTLELEIAPGLFTTWVRAAIREKLSTEVDETDELDDDAEPHVAPSIEDAARTERS